MSHPPEPVTINANPNREIFTTPGGQQYQLTNVANAAYRATLTGNPTKYTHFEKGIPTPKIALPKTEFAETKLAESASKSAMRNSRSYYFKYNDTPIIIADNEYINEENGRYILYTRPSNSAAAGPTPPPVEVFITPATFRKIDATNTKSASTQPEKEMYGADPAAMKALQASIKASIQAKKNAKKSAAARTSRKRSTRKRRSSRKRRA